MCVNLEAASIAHARVHAHMPSGSAPEARLQLGEPGAARGCPLAARGLAAGPPRRSALPAQAASSWPGAVSVQLSLILSLESQIPAVVWENKCAERAEYLMGPFSDRNDSGNEPPLSYGCQSLLGCQGLLLGWLAVLPGAVLPAGACSVPGSGMRCHGLCGMLGGERRLCGAGNG